VNVLSLFDGMSCGMLALDRLGIKVDKYYASEIDKYAMQVSAANYPEIIQVGDITKLDLSTLPKIDLVMGGSPCQGFSFSGKGLAFDDPRSVLFFEFHKVISYLQPKYFLLENVKMKKEYLDIISEYMGIEPIFINSSLVSAQSRQRYYWTNIPNVSQPKDKNIALKDILEYEPSNYTIMSEKFSNRQAGRKCLVDMSKEKAASLSAMEYVKNGRQGDYLACDASGKPKVVCGAYRGRYNEDGSISQRLELRKDQKTNTITTVQKDNVLTKDEVYWRKLTPIECERLQTVPDNYTNHVSNTQRYKMLGNGWTIEVIAHILKGMEI
jgi:DNA-cytosine methyltransferase